jgi:hypothetical protein
MNPANVGSIPAVSAYLKYWLVAFALLAVFASTCSYAASATEFGGTCVYTPAGDADWVNPGNAQGAPDDVAATVTLTKQAVEYVVSDFLACSNFGFAIPAGSRINSITVTLRRFATIAGVMNTGNFSSFKFGSTQWGGGLWGTTWGTDMFGPDLFNTPWTADEINDSGFGFKLRASYFGGDDNTLTASLDSMEVTVDYTPNEVFDDGFETPE